MKNSSEAILVVSAGAVNTGIAEEFLPTGITQDSLSESCNFTEIFFEHTKCVVKFLRSALKCFIFNNVHTIECCHDGGQGTSTSLGIHQLRLLHFKSTNT